MIVSRRFFSWSDVSIRRWLVRHPTFLIKIVSTKGVCTEDRLWEHSRLWSVVPDWPCAAIPLRGHGAMRDATSTVEMSRGYLGYLARGREFRARTEPAFAFGVFVQWDPDVFGRPSPTASISRTPLAERDLGRVTSILDDVTVGDPSHDVIAARIGELFALLRALGMFAVNPPMNDILVAPSPRLVDVGRAIDNVLSRAGTRPMVVDLSQALQCSERQARYLVRDYVGAYALQGATEWRTLVTVWTTYLAGILMTAPGATTERVASLLGYGSPAAFCHALTNAGLPSPGEMRRRVAALA
jgi:hypothetical protein